MRLLLDTHALLWWLADDPALSAQTVEVIAAEADVYVSAVSVWEIAIKRALGKLDAPEGLAAAVVASGFQQLPIRFRHAEVAGALPRHHNDPFDRMLVAQAQCESLTLVTSDARITSYQVAVLPASW
ncbi:MAG: type II toxin-antitoxin system VapC family toxin [Egibacteraceae bacterium]